mgnify:CR=1 FL=1
MDTRLSGTRLRTGGGGFGGNDGLNGSHERMPDDFFSLYLRHAPTMEVPRAFHFWAAMSLLAASVADRVWLEKLKTPLPPNLYVILLGPSAVGKGTAIDVATKFATPRMNLYAGSTTAPALIDYMAAGASRPDGTRTVENSRVWLVMSELAKNIGSGEVADDFIKFLTDYYTPSVVPRRKGTRTHGQRVLHGHCLNWLAGTVPEWFRRALGPDVIEGGFMPRSLVVRGGYAKARVYEPEYPSDYLTLVAHLRERVEELADVRGEFSFAPDAKDTDRAWYLTRDIPPGREPWAYREHDLVLKLAMLLALSDGPSLVIQQLHIVGAQRLLKQVNRNLSDLVSLASTSPRTQAVHAALDYVKSFGRVTHSQLLKMLTNRGLGNADTMKREIRPTLLQTRQVRTDSTPRGGVVYVWAGRRRLSATSEPEPDDLAGPEPTDTE